MDVLLWTSFFLLVTVEVIDFRKGIKKDYKVVLLSAMRKSGIRYKIYKYVMSKAVKRNSRRVVYPTVDNIKKACILADDSDEFHRSEIEKLKKISKTEVLFVSSQKKAANPGDEFINDNRVIYQNDINLIGIPDKQLTNGLIVEPFDVLINLTDGTVDAFEYICAASVAKFKVGTVLNGKIYDLILTQPEGRKMSVVDRLMDTLKRLKSDC